MITATEKEYRDLMYMLRRMKMGRQNIATVRVWLNGDLDVRAWRVIAYLDKLEEA